MDVTFEKVEDERIQKYYDQSFEGIRENPLIRISPGGQLLKERYSLFRDKIQNFKIFEDDVWIATFPRSGTRWLQEMVWCLRHGMNNENGKNLEYRVPYFEIDIHTDVFVGFPLIDDIAKMERPRTIKTHLRYDMIPEQMKVKNTKDWSKETKLSDDYTGKMINRGMTGNWKNQLDDKMIEQMKDWEEKWLKDSDLKFIYEV